MCGIVGGITQRPICNLLIEGLKKLEYRGYDSAGVSLLDTTNKEISTIKVLGKVAGLAAQCQKQPNKSTLGIAHTRWATHGEPAQHNAHPHNSTNCVSIVHNGIIENYVELKQDLIKKGYSFSSETDSEVIAHLINHHYQENNNALQALQKTCCSLKGAYALGVIFRDYPNTLFGARKGSPLVIGIGFEENFIASDPLALLPITQSFIYLQEGDFAQITINSVDTFDHQLKPVQREIKQTQLSATQTEKGAYKHFMHKEIHEQSQVVSDTVASAILNDKLDITSFGNDAPRIFKQTERILIIACGTSLHAGAVAQHWIESIANIPCQIEIASENRYRQRCIEPNTLLIALSQSGETADTLAAMRIAKEKGFLATLAICNVPESSLIRESDLNFLTRAGSEIGVAATKTFTAQLVALIILTSCLSKAKFKHANSDDAILSSLSKLPSLINEVLGLEDEISQLAMKFIEKDHALFLGRGAYHAIAMEGALKLKEISYLHAESYAAGELKHGPLALIDENMPVIVIAPDNTLIDKVISNIKEVQARGGELIIFSDYNLNSYLDGNVTIVSVPTIEPILGPIIYNIPLQLLAYHIAVLRGTDVDQPRNLAKSVTVE